MNEKTLEQYQAVRDAMGFLDLADRGKIEVTGSDRSTFLHAMISNDVQELPEWVGRYATFLTARGKIVSDFFYYKFPEQIVLDITTDLLTKTIETLEKYIVMDEVELKDVSGDSSHYSLQGPAAAGLVEDLFGVSGPEEQYQVKEARWQQTPLWLIRKNELAESGFEIIVPKKNASSLQAAIKEQGRGSGLQEIKQEARNILRLEAAIPWYGVDMDENRYPVEARLDQAISYTKGCYLGQEVVSKATHVGGVSNLLMGLKVQGEQVPSQGSAVSNEAGKQIGTVTSAVFSPRLEGPIAFAYLKRDFAEQGSQCQVEIGDGESAPAEVVEKFF